MDWVDWVLLVIRVVVVFFALLIAVMLYIWMERKVIADMQTRVGPMRAGPRGILITLADGIKLFFKEGIDAHERRPRRLPAGADAGDVPWLSRVRCHPVRHRPSSSSAASSRSSSPTSTSASCGSWR